MVWILAQKITKYSSPVSGRPTEANSATDTDTHFSSDIGYICSTLSTWFYGENLNGCNNSVCRAAPGKVSGSDKQFFCDQRLGSFS